ncbi:histidine phosphatase family protein [Streptomyces sp. TRM66268-LWL]|uniref:Histidine phosphatase family protein n=1 Tax=Streptomyces polyasparticus TaxID=2767826 RepID=A0ABR7SH98_9ACTN|nr:histidine phosphatase family protein [Streptomyces polyasparticus]MBC9714891.1 histidine phosphatase family protein [Streptomyces polyasparticus]
MRWLEVRRHAPTKKGAARGRGSHLSAHGVALARTAGADSGPFASVVTSASPRAIETAIAMGWAVDDTVDLPSGYVEGEVAHHDQWTWPQPYVRYAELIGARGGLAAVAARHRGLWIEVVRSVPDGSGALIVSHGGSIEPALVAVLPAADHASWGAPFSHLDGVRLDFEDGRFIRARMRRAPA